MGKFVSVVALMLTEDELETVRTGLRNCAEPQKLVQDCLFKVEEQLQRFQKAPEKLKPRIEGTLIPKF